jgi:geranylgeranyl diphosphate synthase, type I
MVTSFLEYLRDVAAEVDAAIPGWVERGERLSDPSAQAVHEALASLTMRGGKRLRPGLLALGFEAFGGGDRRRVLPAMAALELLQTYLLIHDDWMDGDSERRGGPTAHVALAKRFGDEAQGARGAILAGDWACALAHEAMTACDVLPARLLEALRRFASMTRDVVVGQTLDVFPPLLEETTLEHIEQVYALKTAAYTVEGPVVIGAALAGMRELGELAHALRHAGVAFQLRDDVLGTFGDARIGKSRGGDLAEGKRTPLLVMLREREPALAARIATRLASEDDLRTAMRMLEGAPRTRLEARIETLVAESTQRIQSLSMDANFMQLFTQAVAWTAQRDH